MTIFRLTIVLIAGFMAGAFQTFAFADEADSLRWYFEGQRQMRDGGVEADFSLYGADALEIDELELFYTIGSSARSKSPVVQLERRNAAYYKKVTAYTRKIVIYSGRYMQLKLWAVAKVGAVTYVAQTAVNLYGQSGVDKTDFEELDVLPPLPGIDVLSQSRYGVMTGEPINFTMKSDYAGPVRIFIDGAKIAELLPENDVYSCVLPNGRKLTPRAGTSYHELLFTTDVFKTDNVDGDVRFSCWLPLYRSTRDNKDFPGGLATLFTAVALSVIAVVLKGRRFKWR